MSRVVLGIVMLFVVISMSSCSYEPAALTEQALIDQFLNRVASGNFAAAARHTLQDPPILDQPPAIASTLAGTTEIDISDVHRVDDTTKHLSGVMRLPDMNSAFAAFLTEALREGATDEPGLEELLSRAVRSAPRKEVYLDEGIKLVEQDGRYVIAEAPFLEFRLRGITRVAARIIELQKDVWDGYLPGDILAAERTGQLVRQAYSIRIDDVDGAVRLSFDRADLEAMGRLFREAAGERLPGVSMYRSEEHLRTALKEDVLRIREEAITRTPHDTVQVDLRLERHYRWDWVISGEVFDFIAEIQSPYSSPLGLPAQALLLISDDLEISRTQEREGRMFSRDLTISGDHAFYLRTANPHSVILEGTELPTGAISLQEELHFEVADYPFADAVDHGERVLIAYGDVRVNMSEGLVSVNPEVPEVVYHLTFDHPADAVIEGDHLYRLGSMQVLGFDVAVNEVITEKYFLSSGELVWVNSLELDGDYHVSSGVAGDFIIYNLTASDGVPRREAAVLDRETGEVVWRAEDAIVHHSGGHILVEAREGVSVPRDFLTTSRAVRDFAAGDSRVAIISNDSVFVSESDTDGVLFSHQLPVSQVRYLGGSFLAYGYQGTDRSPDSPVTAVMSADTGKLRWVRDGMYPVHIGATLILLAGDDEHHIFVDIRYGETIGEYRGTVMGVDDGTVYLLSESAIKAINPQTGRLRWTYEDSDPLIPMQASRDLTQTTADGGLVAFLFEDRVVVLSAAGELVTQMAWSDFRVLTLDLWAHHVLVSFSSPGQFRMVWFDMSIPQGN